MTAAQLKALQNATAVTHEALVAALLRRASSIGKPLTTGTGLGRPWGRKGALASCGPTATPRCRRSRWLWAWARGSTRAFLVTRPPIGYLGWGWESDDRKWNDVFYLQPGEPTGHCRRAGRANLVSSRGTGLAAPQLLTATVHRDPAVLQSSAVMSCTCFNSGPAAAPHLHEPARDPSPRPSRPSALRAGYAPILYCSDIVSRDFSLFTASRCSILLLVTDTAIRLTGPASRQYCTRAVGIPTVDKVYTNTVDSIHKYSRQYTQIQ